MQEILHAFGIDWRLIVIQIFNFSVLMGILWYFLYTPVLKLIADREEKIKKGVADAEFATQERAHAEAEKAALIKEAHVEAGHIYVRATASAEEKEKALMEDAHKKIARDIQSATKLAEEIKAKAIKDSESEIAKISLLTAEKILNAELSK